MEVTPFYVLLKREDPFGLISPEEFSELGIDPDDIPVGTVPALRHPAQIPSRFGGNAYGFGLTEGYSRLNSEELKFILSTNLEDEKSIKENYKKLNDIYKKLGLLIRFSKKGRSYYLIPLHFISSSLTDIKSKVDELTVLIKSYTKNYARDNVNIGIFTRTSDLIFQELSFIFLEHNLIPIESISKLKEIKHKFDIFILIDDIYDVIRRDRLFAASNKDILKKRIDYYAYYLLLKIYKLLQPEGALFVVSKRYISRTDKNIKVKFKSEEEEKQFAIFTHLFKTKKRYKFHRKTLYVNLFDFHNYLSGIYVESEILDRLLRGKDINSLSIDEINRLPYMDLKLPERLFNRDQKKIWSNLFKRFFEEERFISVVPNTLKKEWNKRFEFFGYEPEYMLLYQGRKKLLSFTLYNISKEILEKHLYSSPPELLSDYRNSVEYVISVLQSIDRLVKDNINNYTNIPKIFLDRLRTPLYYRNRRFKGINIILNLVKKIKILTKLINYFNPDHIEGITTKLIENLELIGLFGFDYESLKELYHICLGHGSIRRIVAGKINEASLRPVVEASYSYDTRTALNFLRYFRLMSFVEMEASKGFPVETDEVRELFRIYDLMVRAVISKDVDWDNIVYEGADSIERIRTKVIKRLLMMMSYHRFLNNWQEMKEKGEKELESLADYDPENLKDINNMIRLINVTGEFENIYVKSDPLQLTAFYRKILRADLHGTTPIFGKMDSKNVFLFLWITINTSSTDIINFNPLLSNIPHNEISSWIMKMDQEASYININYLKPENLKNLSEQLNKNTFTIIVGTGFYLRLDPKDKILSIAYMDLDTDISMLRAFCNSFSKFPRISRISNEGLIDLERIFSEMELFYQAHKELELFLGPNKRLPLRHRRWLNETMRIRDDLRSLLLKTMFQPEHFYMNLESLYNYAPSVLNFLFPFFKALQEMDLSWHLYMRLSPLKYILNTTKKLYALIRHKKEEFQDREFLHRLAKKEFGLMATGTIGVSESQIDALIKMLENLRLNRPILFNALIKSFFFQELGRIPYLRHKYKGKFNPADLGHAGSVFIKEEQINAIYYIDQEEEDYLVFLLRYHSMLHHMIRGEFSFFAIEEVLRRKDKDLFDAFFIFSFIMLSAIREDLLLEDLAGKLFKVKSICDAIIDGHIDLNEYMNRLFIKKGQLFFKLRAYIEKQERAVVKNAPIGDLDIINAGKMVYALERILRLRGIRYVEFSELVKLIMDTPISLIYNRKGFLSIGYSTFEKEIFEAQRVYSSFQELPESIRHYMLNWLVDDKIRIFGYEKVTNYLNYDNQIKLLLIVLIGADLFDLKDSPISVNFLDICQIIDKRYEAINDYLNNLSMEEIWDSRKKPGLLFQEKEGIFLSKEEFPNVLTVKFKDKIDIHKKILYMKNATKLNQLKNYYNYILELLKSYPFYSDDYKDLLNQAYEAKLKDLFENIIMEAKIQMDKAKDFQELYALTNEIMKRTDLAEVSQDIKNRLMDLYELRKDSLKREKIIQIDSKLKDIKNINELNKYWNSIKLYLKMNREYTGRDFELLVAKKFDLAERLILRKNAGQWDYV